MPITPKQREERRKHLGASDTPVVMHLAPWGSEAAIQAFKLHGIESGGNSETRKGNYLEDPMGKYVSDETGLELTKRGISRVKDDVFACNLDFRVKGKPAAVECKYVGGQYLDHWGEAGTDQVPDYVRVQVQHQMFVCDLDTVYVGAWLAKFTLDPTLYIVRRDDALIAAIERFGRAWWQKHVVERQPVVEKMPSLDVLSRLPRTTGKMAPVDPDLWAQYQALKEIRLGAERAENGTFALLLQQAGDAEILDYGDDKKVATYFSYDRKDYTVEPSTHRKLYLKDRAKVLPQAALAEMPKLPEIKHDGGDTADN